MQPEKAFLSHFLRCRTGRWGGGGASGTYPRGHLATSPLHMGKMRQGAGKGRGPGRASSCWQIRNGDLGLLITVEVPPTKPQLMLFLLEESPRFPPPLPVSPWGLSLGFTSSRKPSLFRPPKPASRVTPSVGLLSLPATEAVPVSSTRLGALDGQACLVGRVKPNTERHAWSGFVI